VLQFPSTLICVATSFSGKTWLILDLLRKSKLVYNVNIAKIYYVYTHYQAIFDEFKAEVLNVVFTKEIPDIPENNVDNIIIVLDDLLVKHNSSKNSSTITEWFIANSHHRNVAVIVTWQTLFPKHLKTVATNATYYILFPMKRDRQSIEILNRQLFPESPKLLREALEDVEKTKYRYLFINCSATAAFPFRLRNFVYAIKDAKLYIPKDMRPT